MNLSYEALTLRFLLDKALRRLREVPRARPVRRLPEAIRLAVVARVEETHATLMECHQKTVAALSTGAVDGPSAFTTLVQAVDAGFSNLVSGLDCDQNTRLRIERVIIDAMTSLARDLQRKK